MADQGKVAPDGLARLEHVGDAEECERQDDDERPRRRRPERRGDPDHEEQPRGADDEYPSRRHGRPRGGIGGARRNLRQGRKPRADGSRRAEHEEALRQEARREHHVVDVLVLEPGARCVDARDRARTTRSRRARARSARAARVARARRRRRGARARAARPRPSRRPPRGRSRGRARGTPGGDRRAPGGRAART